MNQNFMPKDKRLLPREGEEQARLFSWAAMHSMEHPELALLFHIPNGGKRSKTEAARFQAEGVKPGVQDLFLPVSRSGYHGMFVELKRQAGGRVSREQNEWIKTLVDQGYRAFVAKGWEEAAREILLYLEGGFDE